MANRTYNDPAGSFHRRVVHLFGLFSTSAGGAVTAEGVGLTTKGLTMSHAGGGLYNIDVAGNYNKILDIGFTLHLLGAPAGADGTEWYMTGFGYSSATDILQIGIQFGRRDGAGAWVNGFFAGGNFVRLRVTLDNSTI